MCISNMEVWGWNLCVEWKEGTSSWERLADLKERNSVEVAEYAVSENLHNAPDFLCWVPHLLKKRNHIIDSEDKTYHKMTHKFDIEVPRSWDDYVILDITLYAMIQ
jgi:hypothetical protein